LSSFATQFESVLDTLISSKTRVKLLLKFFLNSSATSYLRGLETEFGESTNAIRLELNRLEEAGMLSAEAEGNRKVYRANTNYPLYNEINAIIRKNLGIDTIITSIVDHLGKVDQVFVTGSFARGIDSPIIDLLLVGDIDKAYLVQLIDKVEPLILRRIRYMVLSSAEFALSQEEYTKEKALLIWTKEVE
jgi:predicted nucleotidyltransferase